MNKRQFKKEAKKIIPREWDIREINEIVFSRFYNGVNYSHTGRQVFICGVWWNEYEDEDGNIEFLN